MHFGYTWESHWAMWIFMLIFWILVILGAVAIFRWVTNSKAQSSESALEILKKRYAKGEITKKSSTK
jgi:putative membrane protein